MSRITASRTTWIHIWFESYYHQKWIGLFVFIFLTGLSIHPLEAQVKEGRIVIHSRHDIFPLKGQWRFKPGDDLRYKDPDFPDQAWSFIRVEANWRVQGHRGLKTGWYRVHLELKPQDVGNLALALPSVSFAYNLYFNGVLLGGCGKIDTKGNLLEKSSRPRLHIIPAHLIRMKGHNVISLRVAGYGGGGGLKSNRLHIGGQQASADRYVTEHLIYMFYAAGFLLIAVYHLILFLGRRDEYDNMFFAVLCGLIGFFQLGYSGVSSLFWDNYWVTFILMHASITTFAFLLIGFGVTFFNFQYRRVLIALGILVVIFLSTALYAVYSEEFFAIYMRYIVPGEFIVALLSVLFFLGLVIKGLRLRKLGAKTLGFGFSVLMAALANDALAYMGIVGSVNAMAPAFLCVVVSMAVALAFKFSRLHIEKQVAQGQALVAMQKSNELKDEFLANTSHELRTPLNGIIGISDSMLQGIGAPHSPETASNLQMISSSGRRLANLVNDILDFSRLNYGDIVLNRKVVDVVPLIEIVLELSRPLVDIKKVALVYDKCTTPLVYADENRLQQILHNLIGNAIKFTSNGEIRIRADWSTDNLDISIADTGIGISPEKHDLIFESFTQADGSVAREYGGTGIGLSVTKELVKLHGGVIRVESTPGKGSCFTFTLPLANEKATEDDFEKSTSRVQHIVTTSTTESDTTVILAPVSDDSTSSSEPIQILAVDDDAVNLKVLQNHLKLQNHNVTEAMSGQQALKYFEDGRTFDLILLDVMMPGLSGYEVCRILRETHSESQLPIIMLTAKNRVADLIAGLESGANDYLTKPFDSRELLARVNTMIQLKIAAQSQSDLAMLKNEMELAQSIQQSLLPDSVPEYPGLRISTRYRSMINVGGDFYDFRLQENGIGAILADVSGHGVPAALIVSVVKMAFWFQKENLALPEKLLRNMNEILMGNIGNEFVTGCYFFIDTHRNKLIVGNAGHPPILLWKNASRDLQKIRPFGRLLGIMPDAEFESEQVSLDPGDRILVYTDGVYETSDRAGDHFGERRLHDFIAEHAQLAGNEFADQLIKTVTEWSGGEEQIDDDIAIIVVDID